MTILNARVAGEIEIPMDQLEAMPAVLKAIKEELEFLNEDKQKLLDEKVWSAREMPDTIDMWQETYRRGGARLMLLPRGFASTLIAGCASMGVTVQIEDNRSLAPASPGYYRPFVMRDYQFLAATKLIQQQQGMYKSPAGSGKTVTMLGAVAHLGQRALIIVDKESLLEQWRTRAATFYGFDFTEKVDKGTGKVTRVAKLTKGGDTKLREVGKIGQGVFEERDLTIALRQSLFSKDSELEPLKWYREWGVTIFDEAHHLSADTMQDVCRHMTSFYLWGTSATPAKSDTRGKIVYSLVGPIVHETPRQILRERGILMTPKVRVVRTDFEAQFWPTHDFIPSKPGEEDHPRQCVVPDCDKSHKGHQHRNNWSSVLKKLVEDKKRNADIAAFITMLPEEIHLIPTSQKKHIDLITKALKKAGYPGKIHVLTGEENAKGVSQDIAQEIEQDSHLGHVILSTVAGEGLDIPPINYVHGVYPMRQKGALEQLFGRGERAWPGKDESWIIDWRDDGCSVFASQAETRMEVYAEMGYPVTFETVDELLKSVEHPPPAIEMVDAVEAEIAAEPSPF